MLKLYTLSHYDNKSGNINFSSPYWHIKYRPPPREIDYWVHAAIELCKTDVTHELFGLSFADLLEMDVATFKQISKVIKEIRKERETQREKMQEAAKIGN